MKKIITASLFAFITMVFNGCTAKLAPEVVIPPAPQVNKMNHELTIVNQHKIQKKYFEYTDDLLTGIVSGAFNKVNKINYYEELKTKDVDMSHEKLYDCKISQMLGNFPGKYFHNMYVVSNKRIPNKAVSVALNKNDVNEFIVYGEKDGHSSIYDHKDGGYGFAIIGLPFDLDNLIAIRYKCEKVSNTIFKPDDHRPVYE